MRIASATSGSSSNLSWSERSRAACWVSKQRFSAGIFSSERPQRQEISWTGRTERHLREQPFQIENSAELLAQFGAQDGLLEKILHSIQPLLDLGAIERGAEQSLAQETPRPFP